MNIILCGMPGCGKSYFGALIAQKLNRTFVDTDKLVVSEYHQQATCREIVLRDGAQFFRRLESKVVQELANIQNSVVAIGGGTLCTPENIPILRNLGWMIYLKVSPQILLERLKTQSSLPAYLDKADIEGSFEALLTQRLPLYEQHCHGCVDVHSEDVLQVLCSWGEKPHGE